MKQIIIAVSLVLANVVQAQSYLTKYELTITNGSKTPISPGVIYTKTGGETAIAIGSNSSVGFTQLCQTGNVTERIAELKATSDVNFLMQTTAPILPGESKVLIVEISNPITQSLHFEAMYGKSKDTCSVGSVNSHSLIALKQHVTSEVIQKMIHF